MVKLEFQNAKVTDVGYGLNINDKPLDEIISTVLGTRVGNRYGYGSNLPDFKAECCNVTIIIDPQPTSTYITNGADIYHSVEDLEEDKYEQFKKNTEKTNPAE